MSGQSCAQTVRMVGIGSPDDGCVTSSGGARVWQGPVALSCNGPFHPTWTWPYKRGHISGALYAGCIAVDGDPVSLDDLAHFLNSDNAPQGCMDLSELDGFLAGLVAGPEQVPRDEWMAEVWDNEEPDYVDEAEHQAVEQAIFDRYDAIEAGLDAT